MSHQPIVMLASLRWMDEQQQDALVLSGGWLCRRQVSRPPDQVTVTPLDGAAAPTGSPITLAGNRSLAYLPEQGQLVGAGWGRLQQRITSPSTVGSDQQKRRVA